MKPLEKGSLAPEQPPQNLDATHNIASEEELRRRAAEGDQVAVAERARRAVEEMPDAQRQTVSEIVRRYTPPGHPHPNGGWVHGCSVSIVSPCEDGRMMVTTGDNERCIQALVSTAGEIERVSERATGTLERVA